MWSTILVLDRQLILEEIWVSIQFYVFLCAWNFLVAVCTLFLSLSWHFYCQCRETNKNGTTMWGFGLEEILLLIIFKHVGESAIVYSSICPRVFLHLGMKFPYDRKDLLVEIFIFLRLVLFRPCGRGLKVANKWNHKAYETIYGLCLILSSHMQSTLCNYFGVSQSQITKLIILYNQPKQEDRMRHRP